MTISERIGCQEWLPYKSLYLTKILKHLTLFLDDYITFVTSICKQN